jgi:hypothetical protein
LDSQTGAVCHTMKKAAFENQGVETVLVYISHSGLEGVWRPRGEGVIQPALYAAFVIRTTPCNNTDLPGIIRFD